MTDRQPIDTAPRDGTWITLITPSMEFTGFMGDGFIDHEWNDTAAWCSAREGEHPECWTDGVCWAENANGVPSEKPTHWRPLGNTGEPE